MYARPSAVRSGFAALVGLAALHTSGCTDTVGPGDGLTLGRAPSAHHASPMRPFQGRIAGQLTLVPPFAPGSHVDCNANFSGDPAAPGPSVSLFDEASGQFSHLGRARLEAVSCLDPASPTSTGTGTITAASGDLLFIAFENEVVPDPSDPSRLLASGPQWVTGGSGRFAGAYGTQFCEFTIVPTSPSTAEIAGACEGRLAY